MALLKLVDITGRRPGFFLSPVSHFLSARKEIFRLSNRLRERLAFVIMFFTGYNYYHNKQPLTLHSLVDLLDLPVDPIHDVLTLLEKNSLLLETGDDPRHICRRKI
jgi:hypothetical protein